MHAGWAADGNVQLEPMHPDEEDGSDTIPAWHGAHKHESPKTWLGCNHVTHDRPCAHRGGRDTMCAWHEDSQSQWLQPTLGAGGCMCEDLPSHCGSIPRLS